MPWIIILIVIISIISKANKKKKAEEAAKKARQAQAFEQASTPPQGRSARFPDEFEGTPPRQAAEPAKRNNPTQAEIEARRRAMQQKLAAQQAKQAPPVQQRRQAPIQTTLTHVVKPVTESAHAHTESSMGGGEHCPPAVQTATIPAPTASEARVYLPKLGFTRDEVVKGILYAEILGKPKALRK